MVGQILKHLVLKTARPNQRITIFITLLFLNSYVLGQHSDPPSRNVENENESPDSHSQTHTDQIRDTSLHAGKQYESKEPVATQGKHLEVHDTQNLQQEQHAQDSSSFIPQQPEDEEQILIHQVNNHRQDRQPGFENEQLKEQEQFQHMSHFQQEQQEQLQQEQHQHDEHVGGPDDQFEIKEEPQVQTLPLEQNHQYHQSEEEDKDQHDESLRFQPQVDHHHSQHEQQKYMPNEDQQHVQTKEHDVHQHQQQSDPNLLQENSQAAVNSELPRENIDSAKKEGEKFDEKIKEEKQEITPEEIEAERLYQAGEKLINATYSKEYKEAYLYFLKAAELNHTIAKAHIAYGMLFGDYIPQNVTKASEMLKELSALGLPKAQMGLAFMYSSGFHFNSSQAKALIFLTFGALGDDTFAQMSLGYRYYAGISVESKCETALTYYRKVATKVAEGVTFSGGLVVQRIRLQEEAESQGNNSPLLDDDLLQYYHFLADKGDQQAMIVLGTLYYQGGKGVIINHEQAYHYFSTAAESGNAHALGYLGKMHSEGSPFVKQSNHTAFEYFKMSADKSNHIGQAGLGLMYLKGLGVDKNTDKAFRYFSLASDQGSVDGQLQLGIMYFTGVGIRKDYKMAVKYFTLASQNGHVLAYYNLAQMHATGTGVLRNCHTAVELFKNVAERGRWSEMLMEAHRMYQNGNLDTAIIKYMFLAELGYEVAQSNVAYILDNGISSKFEKYETYQRALLQYSRAAVQGSTQARLKIGDYHYYGCGTEVDYESAASHYRIASEQQRNAQAMFNLGYMHERGLGMKQDVHLAKRFYDMAAETSIDAHIPVTLALLKLGLFYGVDVFSKEFEGLSGVLQALDPEIYFGNMWDIYLASLMALGFTVLYFLRRMR